MNIYTFRVILDTEEDVFRDIEIATDTNFEEFHYAILKAFDFEGMEMASFYMSNEHWDRGQEISLLDMNLGGGDGEVLMMKAVKLEDLIKSPSEKILYVYDFLRMWCFYIELITHKKAAPSTLYPRVSLIYGEAPSETSKEMDLLADFGQSKPGDDDDDYLTGDPELDEFLSDDDDDEPGFSSLDDLDDDLY